jgi:hypothetical protein
LVSSWLGLFVPVLLLYGYREMSKWALGFCGNNYLQKKKKKKKQTIFNRLLCECHTLGQCNNENLSFFFFLQMLSQCLIFTTIPSNCIKVV